MENDYLAGKDLESETELNSEEEQENNSSLSELAAPSPQNPLRPEVPGGRCIKQADGSYRFKPDGKKVDPVLVFADFSDCEKHAESNQLT